MVIGITSLIGAYVVLALAMILVKSLTLPGYFPKAWHNTLLTFGMVIAGLLTLRFFDTSWRHAFFLFNFFCIAALAVMTALEHRMYAVQMGQPFDYEHVLYASHLSVLLVAFILGFKPAWLMSGAVVIYVMWLGALRGDIPGVGLPIFVALALPFTAVLVERLLDEAEKEARRAHYAETSINIMTHDLGSPLAVLASSLDMLRESDLSNDHRETLVWAIQRSTRTLRRLLEEFREFPHLDKAAPMERVNLTDIVEDIVEFYAQPLAQGYGQTLSADLQPVEVIGTASRLSRVVRELLTNAIKYTQRGGHVEVTLQADEQVTLQVSDNGWGIEEDDLAYVFDPHWRGANASPRGISGTGLGLYICKTIAERHGGRIEVESQPDKGSTFTFHLPLPKATIASPLPDGNSDEETTESRPRISLPSQR